MQLFSKQQHRQAAACFVIAAGAIGAGAFASDEPVPDPPPISKFASAPALMSQVDYYLGRLEKALKNESKYSEASQTRVAKDANTLVVLLMGLGLHDAESDVRSAAPRLVELAEELAAAADDYKKASAAFHSLATGIAGGADGGRPLKWEKRFELELLMKQVTTVNNRLKRNTKSAKSLKKRKEDAMGQAALLAIVGQATLVDPEVVEEPDRIGEWRKLCATMRDAAGDVGKSIADDDYEAVARHMKVLQQNCDHCHDAFRIETK